MVKYALHVLHSLGKCPGLQPQTFASARYSAFLQSSKLKLLESTPTSGFLPVPSGQALLYSSKVKLLESTPKPDVLKCQMPQLFYYSSKLKLLESSSNPDFLPVSEALAFLSSKLKLLELPKPQTFASVRGSGFPVLLAVFTFNTVTITSLGVQQEQPQLAGGEILVILINASIFQVPVVVLSCKLLKH